MSDVPGVLADLLVLASEAGSETLVTTDRLLRNLVGDSPVQAAHEAWTSRLREGPTAVSALPSTAACSDVFDLVARLRASRPGGVS